MTKKKFLSLTAVSAFGAAMTVGVISASIPGTSTKLYGEGASYSIEYSLANAESAPTVEDGQLVANARSTKMAIDGFETGKPGTYLSATLEDEQFASIYNITPITGASSITAKFSEGSTGTVVLAMAYNSIDLYSVMYGSRENITMMMAGLDEFDPVGGERIINVGGDTPIGSVEVDGEDVDTYLSDYRYFVFVLMGEAEADLTSLSFNYTCNPTQSKAEVTDWTPTQKEMMDLMGYGHHNVPFFDCGAVTGETEIDMDEEDRQLEFEYGYTTKAQQQEFYDIYLANGYKQLYKIVDAEIEDPGDGIAIATIYGLEKAIENDFYIDIQAQFVSFYDYDDMEWEYAAMIEFNLTDIPARVSSVLTAQEISDFIYDNYDKHPGDMPRIDPSLLPDLDFADVFVTTYERKWWRESEEDYEGTPSYSSEIIACGGNKARFDEFTDSLVARGFIRDPFCGSWVDPVTDFEFQPEGGCNDTQLFFSVDPWTHSGNENNRYLVKDWPTDLVLRYVDEDVPHFEGEIYETYNYEWSSAADIQVYPVDTPKFQAYLDALVSEGYTIYRNSSYSLEAFHMEKGIQIRMDRYDDDDTMQMYISKFSKSNIAFMIAGAALWPTQEINSFFLDYDVFQPIPSMDGANEYYSRRYRDNNTIDVNAFYSSGSEAEEAFDAYKAKLESEGWNYNYGYDGNYTYTNEAGQNIQVSADYDWEGDNIVFKGMIHVSISAYNYSATCTKEYASWPTMDEMNAFGNLNVQLDSALYMDEPFPGYTESVSLTKNFGSSGVRLSYKFSLEAYTGEETSDYWMMESLAKDWACSYLDVKFYNINGYGNDYRGASGNSTIDYRISTTSEEGYGYINIEIYGGNYEKPQVWANFSNSEIPFFKDIQNMPGYNVPELSQYGYRYWMFGSGNATEDGQNYFNNSTVIVQTQTQEDASSFVSDYIRHLTNAGFTQRGESCLVSPDGFYIININNWNFDSLSGYKYVQITFNASKPERHSLLSELIGTGRVNYPYQMYDTLSGNYYYPEQEPMSDVPPSPDGAEYWYDLTNGGSPMPAPNYYNRVMGYEGAAVVVGVNVSTANYEAYLASLEVNPEVTTKHIRVGDKDRGIVILETVYYYHNMIFKVSENEGYRNGTVNVYISVIRNIVPEIDEAYNLNQPLPTDSALLSGMNWYFNDENGFYGYSYSNSNISAKKFRDYEQSLLAQGYHYEWIQCTEYWNTLSPKTYLALVNDEWMVVIYKNDNYVGSASYMVCYSRIEDIPDSVTRDYQMIDIGLEELGSTFYTNNYYWDNGYESFYYSYETVEEAEGYLAILEAKILALGYEKQDVDYAGSYTYKLDDNHTIILSIADGTADYEIKDRVTLYVNIFNYE